VVFNQAMAINQHWRIAKPWQLTTVGESPRHGFKPTLAKNQPVANHQRM